MNIFQAIILGVIEGITEFLPISSTGHLIIASKLMGLNGEFTKTFEIAIQSGTMLAVILLYGSYLLSNRELLKKTIVAFIPTGIIGYLLYKILKEVLLSNIYITLTSLLLGGLFLIFFELYQKRSNYVKVKDISYKKAVLIGLIQSLSIIPGVSRSAATIIGGLALGLDRKTAVEFSFILAIPTLLAATTLDLVKNLHSFSNSEFGLLGLGFITSALVAVVVIKGFLSYIRKYSFIPFGVYRVILSLIFFFLMR